MMPVTGNNLRTDSDSGTIHCAVHGDFAEWLASQSGSLAITTYQAGKVVLVGSTSAGQVAGLASEGSRLALACRHEVLLFANAPSLAHDYLEAKPGLYDALYLPRVAYFTGDLNVHDVAFGDAGLWIVATRFSCLAAVSSDFSFEPRWHPPFISQLAPEDRCHLNGLGMKNGRPKYVTALGETDEPGGWRTNKATGGILIDVETGEIVLRDLSMPHSPRWYDGRWWLLNSGRGELWTIDTERGSHEVVCALPGYLRGLSFTGTYALVGLSQIREKHIFGGLPIQEQHQTLRCGVAVIDLRSGCQIGLLDFTEGCRELYGLDYLTDMRRPTILNLQRDAARQAFTAPEFSYWLRPSSEIPTPRFLSEPKLRTD